MHNSTWYVLISDYKEIKTYGIN